VSITGGCNKEGKIPEDILWKDVSQEPSQILFDRVNFGSALMRDGISRVVNELND